MVIQESPEDDVRRSTLADKLIQACVSYLYKQTTLRTYDFNNHGTNLPYLQVGDIDNVPRIFDGTIIVFFDDERDYAGRASTVYDPNGYWKYAIFLHVEDISSPKKIMFALNDRNIKDTLQHEIQHVLDKIRRKTKKPFNPNDQKSNSAAGPEKYFNSPEELNAYFHNIAEPILERIRFGKRHGAEMMGIFAPLSDDFREWFADRISSLYGSKGRYWQYLTDQNKRKVIKRLEKLHALYVKLNATSKAKYSEETEEIDV